MCRRIPVSFLNNIGAVIIHIIEMIRSRQREWETKVKEKERAERARERRRRSKRGKEIRKRENVCDLLYLV